MEMQITTLSENTASHGFLGEWGLSILVEVDGTRILMDTGMSFTATYNAQLLGIDLRNIDAIVLSHGHNDHTGGLHDVLKRKQGQVKIVAHPDLWSSKYTRSRIGEEYIGIPFTRESLEGLGAQFNLSRQSFHITENVMTTGEIPMLSGYETIDDNLVIEHGADFISDPLADDLALIIQTGRGLVVILGCAHHGMVNTLRHAQKLTGQQKIFAVIGGTHLYPASPERIERTIADLREMGIEKLGVSHCTGFAASSRLANAFPDAFFLNNAGMCFAL